MKILYFSFVDISLPKGPSVNEREFILSLAKTHKNKAHFVIPKPEYPIADELPLNNISFLRKAKIQQIGKKIRQQTQAVRVINDLIKEKEFDLMIIRGGLFGFSIRQITTKNNLPYAMKTAGSGKFNVFKEKNILIRSLYSLNQRIFKKIINDAIAVDVVSTIQKESLEKITGAKGKIHFIDNGVNTDRFYIKNKAEVRKTLGLSHFKQIIGYVGGSPWERGGLQIIESIPLLLQDYPNLGGVIVGGGAKMQLLYDRAKELNVEKHIVFVGIVPFEEVNDYINTFDIGISQLYKDKQGSSEQKVRQYLACGKPIIVSPGAVNNFVETESLGHIVKDPYNYKEFAQKVASILQSQTQNDPIEAGRIRDYAKKHLSVDSRVAERLDLYKAVLNG